MIKNSFSKKSLFFLLTLVLFLTYPNLSASFSSLRNAQITISDSRPLFANTRHIHYFRTTLVVPTSGRIVIDLAPGAGAPFDLGVGHSFSDMTMRHSVNDDMSSPTTCTLAATPGAGVVGVAINNADEIITLTLAPSGACSGLPANQFVEITMGDGAAGGLNDVQNPAKVAAAGTADTYLIEYQTQNASAVTIDTASVRAAIIDAVTITAEVKATLSCQVAGVAPAENFNTLGNTYGAAGFATTATAIPFGVINSGSSSQSGQILRVSTNATNGFHFAVRQYSDLTAAGGATINTFRNGVLQDNTSPDVWAAPLGTPGSLDTYGHLGYGTTDLALDDLAGAGAGNRFTGARFAGLSNLYEAILSHNAPANGVGGADPNGQAYIVYRVEISGLQEAGVYFNTVSYLCTGRY